MKDGESSDREKDSIPSAFSNSPLCAVEWDGNAQITVVDCYFFLVRECKAGSVTGISACK